jgi:hypothetical protein
VKGGSEPLAAGTDVQRAPPQGHSKFSFGISAKYLLYLVDLGHVDRAPECLGVDHEVEAYHAVMQRSAAR